MIEMLDTESLVPEGHLLRQVEPDMFCTDRFQNFVVDMPEGIWVMHSTRLSCYSSIPNASSICS